MRIAGTRYLATRQVYYSKPENEGCRKTVHVFHGDLVVKSPVKLSCIKLGCQTGDCYCYCEMPLYQDWTLLHVTMPSAFVRLDNLKLKSPYNSTFARAQFHTFGRD
jgi:hypothetical protein